jgi:hypothetical protein
MRPKLGQEGSEAFFEIVSESFNVQVLDRVLAHFVKRLGEEVLKSSSGYGDEGKARELSYRKHKYEGAAEIYKLFMEEVAIRKAGTGDQVASE